jgi:hypothetical protein
MSGKPVPLRVLRDKDDVYTKVCVDLVDNDEWKKLGPAIEAYLGIEEGSKDHRYNKAWHTGIAIGPHPNKPKVAIDTFIIDHPKLTLQQFCACLYAIGHVEVANEVWTAFGLSCLSES